MVSDGTRELVLQVHIVNIQRLSCRDILKKRVVNSRRNASLETVEEQWRKSSELPHQLSRKLGRYQREPVQDISRTPVKLQRKNKRTKDNVQQSKAADCQRKHGESGKASTAEVCDRFIVIYEPSNC